MWGKSQGPFLINVVVKFIPASPHATTGQEPLIMREPLIMWELVSGHGWTSKVFNTVITLDTYQFKFILKITDLQSAFSFSIHLVLEASCKNSDFLLLISSVLCLGIPFLFFQYLYSLTIHDSAKLLNEPGWSGVYPPISRSTLNILVIFYWNFL